MSETEPEKSRKAIPLLFWLVIVTLMGLAIGLWQPWKKGLTHTPNSPELLIQQLRDPARSKTAYLQLVSSGEAAGPGLLAAAKDEAFPARSEAIELLGRVRYQPAIEYLVSLQDPALGRVRLTALGNIGGPEALAELRKGLSGGGEEIRFVALRKLSDWPEPVERALRDEVLVFLKDTESGRREFAALFCGRQRDEQAVTPLVACLDDPQGDVRKAAAWALAQIGDEEGLKAVQAAYARGAIPEDR